VQKDVAPSAHKSIGGISMSVTELKKAVKLPVQSEVALKNAETIASDELQLSV